MLELVQGGVVVLAIGILIFVHELGHFLVAKKVGIRVEAFSLGFGPTIWGFTRGDTTYKLSLIPLGGYVKMAGEFKEEGDEATGEEFFSKTISQRAWVISAGVIMNIFFAIIAFPLAFSIGVPFTAPVVGKVLSGDSAWEAGIRPGDIITKIDGEDVISFADIRTSVAFNDTAQEFVIKRDDQEISCTVRPRYDDDLGMHVIGLGGKSTFSVNDEAKDLPDGIEAGMEILAVDGIPVHADSPRIGTGYFAEGEIITLTVRKNGSDEPIDVKIPAQFEKIDDDSLSLGIAIVGLKIKKIRKGEDGPTVAAQLNIQEGDLLVALNGTSLASSNGVVRRIYSLRGGNTLKFVVMRDGKEVELSTDSWDGDPLSFLSSIQLSFADDVQISVFEGTPAYAAGLRDGDVLLSYDDKKIDRGWDGWIQFMGLKEKAGDDKKTIVIRRDGEELTFGIKAMPTQVNVLTKKLVKRPFEQRVQLPFPESVTVGFDQAVSQFKSILMTLKSLFSGKVAAKNLGGIITIAVVSYTFVEQGMGKILFFMAILSLNLAVLNILPIPVLDGGHLMFLALEKIKGGPLSERLMGYANVVGLVFILGLMVFVTFHDIRRFFF